MDKIADLVETWHVRKLLCILFIFIASACDTFPRVKTDLPWQEGFFDQNCIQKAINSVSHVLFLELKVFHPKDTCVVGECLEKTTRFNYNFSPELELKSPYHGSIDLNEYEGGKKTYQNYVNGQLGKRKFLGNEQAVFEKKLREINDSVKASCK